MPRSRTTTTPPPVRPGRWRALRLAARLTQLALARKMGVSAQTIWLLDTDRKQPSEAHVKKLLAVLKALPLLALLLAPGALAQTVYVAPTGNDSTPCASVTTAAPRLALDKHVSIWYNKPATKKPLGRLSQGPLLTIHCEETQRWLPTILPYQEPAYEISRARRLGGLPC